MKKMLCIMSVLLMLVGCSKNNDEGFWIYSNLNTAHDEYARSNFQQAYDTYVKTWGDIGGGSSVSLLQGIMVENWHTERTMYPVADQQGIIIAFYSVVTTQFGETNGIVSHRLPLMLYFFNELNNDSRDALRLYYDDNKYYAITGEKTLIITGFRVDEITETDELTVEKPDSRRKVINGKTTLIVTDDE